MTGDRSTAQASRVARRVAIALALFLASPALAVDPFEIQVYEADVDEPGQTATEIHLNYTFSGLPAPPAPGAIPINHSIHLTLEESVGLTRWLELGAYLQTLGAPGTWMNFGGVKLRAKTVVPGQVTEPFFLGLNAEIAYVPPAVAPEAWSVEVRPILGWTDGTFLVALNPIFGWSLEGPDAWRVELDPAAKVEVNTQLGFSLGVEYYMGLGFANAILPPREEQQLLFGVFDLVAPKGAPESPWELDVGLGAGLTPGTAQKWIVKVIAGRTF
jgi:hypothetical protein